MKFTILRSLSVLTLLTLSVLAQSPEGQFFRTYWYQRGIEFGNPKFDDRFRVNAPDAVLNPNYSQRVEVRENGMMLIPINEDLRQIYRAELYLELWGGHPGTANKRVTVNGRSTYSIQDVGTFNKHCTHQYPTLYLQPTDLVNGYNAFQFACDRGSSFWGHFIVDNAALRIELRRNHQDLQKAGLRGFNALIKAEAVPGNQDAIRLKLSSSDDLVISAVDYQGFYYGYDENGDTMTYGWHGMTKNKEPHAIIGTAQQYPFSVDWDTAMLQEQQEMAVRAIVHFKDHPEFTYVTPVIGGLYANKPKGTRVTVYASRDLPAPFWSRANQKKACSIEVDIDPARIERAELNVVVWDGGAGKVKEYFTLNGTPLAIAGNGKHDVLYRKIPLDPKILKRGTNRIELLSDTEHHGLEILLPGPALVIRSK
jgi:hypothetical protein